MKKTREERYDLFKEKVITSVKQYYGEEYEVTIHPVQKNNGLILYGLNILKKDTHVCPTIYMEDYFNRYEGGCAFSSLFREIIDMYEKYKEPNFADLEYFYDYEKIREGLMVKIINVNLNKELLEDVPHRIVNDLAIVCLVEIAQTNNHIGSVLIRNNHICMWGIRAQQLIDEAIESSARNNPIMFRKLSDYIMEIYDKELDEEGNAWEEERMDALDGDAPTMYLLTNAKQMFGAASMVYPGVLKEISEKLGENYYIIPSSIHELIILPASVSGHIENINEMISSINSEMLSAEEVLSNHAYQYDIKSETIISLTNEILSIES